MNKNDIPMTSHYFDCACGSSEHTLRFVLDSDNNTIYTLVFLNQYRGFWKRLLVAIKYLFGYKCKYGHWDEWILKPEDVTEITLLLNKIKNDIK